MGCPVIPAVLRTTPGVVWLYVAVPVTQVVDAERRTSRTFQVRTNVRSVVELATPSPTAGAYGS